MTCPGCPCSGGRALVESPGSETGRHWKCGVGKQIWGSD